MSLSQKNRFLSIETPLGKDALMLVGLTGREALSEGFRFDLDLISEDDAINFRDIIGESVTVTMTLNQGRDNEKIRYINGIVASFQQGSPPKEIAQAGVAAEFYHAVIVPWSWLLTRMTNCRIFQEKDVKDIVEQIFNDRGSFDFEWKLTEKSKYKKRSYCVQYRETDFNFISRLFEEEGIHYFFRHEDGKHTMVIADAPDPERTCELHKNVKFHDGPTGMLDDDFIISLSRSLEITTTKHTLNDFNFESPNSSLLVETETNQDDNKGKGDREIYDFPGKYIEYSHGEHFGKIRMETHEAGLTSIRGTSQCQGFSPGYNFKLEEYFREDMNEKKYLLTSVEHEGKLGYEPSGITSPPSYSNRFVCIPHDIPYRPPQKSRKPVIQGVQTAIVVGPSGEEIYPDTYGRVKVQFHWDREGANDEKSSCWVRVSQPWAGAGWGGMFIPHIGHEVIVDFVEGDPDRPIITGRVYHGNNMPADTLPDEKTKSVIRSWGDNDIVIEDKEGDKHIQIKQANGNEILMHESTPNIEIKQACGNEILMHASEGIQIRDKFGNEVVLDAVAGTLKLRSPSHESTIELGKSIWLGTLSDLRRNVQGNAFSVVHGSQDEYVAGPARFKWDGTNFKFHGGLVSDTFVGGKHTAYLAITADTFKAKKYEFSHGTSYKRYYSKEDHVNYSTRGKRTKGAVLLDSDTKYHIIGGDGDASNLVLQTDQALLSSKDSLIRIKANGNILLQSEADAGMVAKDKIVLASGNGGKPLQIKANDVAIDANIKQKNLVVKK